MWIVDAYGFAVAGLLLIMGNVGDRIGRRRLLLIGAAGFAVASILAAFAPTSGMLIVSRALLGVAGATLMPSTLSLIRDLFDDDGQRQRAIAIWMASLLTGTALGPLIGAVTITMFWWGAVFLLAVPIMVLLLIIGPMLLPAGTSERPTRLDWGSVSLFALAIAGVVYAIKRAASHGVEVPAVAAVIVGTLAGVIFVRRQRRLDEPLLDVGLFHNARFATATATHLGALLALGGLQYLFALYLQLGLGLPPVRAGFWTLPGAALGLLGALLAPILARRLGPRLVISGMLAIGAAAAAVLTLTTLAGPQTAAAGFALVSLAVGLVTTLTTDHVIAAAPARRAGMASGITETAAELGIALGVALLGSITTAVQANRTSRPLAADASPEARQAFIEGFHASALVAALILTALATVTLRHLRRPSDHNEEAL